MKRDIDSIQDLEELASQYGQSNPSPRRRSIETIEQIPNIENVSDAGIEWAVHKLLPMSAITLVSGDSGSGKSTFASFLAYQISVGGIALGRRCIRRPVLTLDGENPLSMTRDRFRRLNICSHDLLKVWGNWVGDGPPSAGAPIVLEWVQRMNPKPLIIVDSFVGFHPGNENDSSETRRYMARYRLLTNLGAAVLILHHSGKSESSRLYRGSSDIKAGIDIGYALTNLSHHSKLGTLRLRAFKTRVEVENELTFNYADGRFEHVEPEPMRTGAEKLAELLRRNPGILVAAFERLAAEEGLGRNRARQFVQQGIDTGSITVERGTRNQRRLTLKDGN